MMWPFRRRTPTVIETVPSWSWWDRAHEEITGEPAGFRWVKRLTVYGRSRAGGSLDVVLDVRDVADASIDPSGKWLSYVLNDEDGRRSRITWKRLADTDVEVDLKLHEELTTVRPKSRTP